MMMTLSEEELIELVLLSGREGWSQTYCAFYHVSRLYRQPFTLNNVYKLPKSEAQVKPSHEAVLLEGVQLTNAFHKKWMHSVMKTNIESNCKPANIEAD